MSNGFGLHSLVYCAVQPSKARFGLSGDTRQSSALRRRVRNWMDQWFRRVVFPSSGNSCDVDTL